jgi:hypothetical protein
MDKCIREQGCFQRATTADWKESTFYYSSLINFSFIKNVRKSNLNILTILAYISYHYYAV